MNDLHVRPRGQAHFYATEPTVVRWIRWRIGNEVLAAQFAFYLTKIVQQIIRPVREIGSPACLFAHTPKHVFAHALESEAVADSYRVDDHPGAPRAINGFFELAAAGIVNAVRKQYHRATCNVLITGGASIAVARQHLVSSDVDGVIERRCLAA